MICGLRAQAAFLILGLVYSIPAAAEEHPAAAAPAIAEKPAAAAAKAKPATEPAEARASNTTAVADSKRNAPDGAAAKAAVPSVVSAPRPAIVQPLPQRARPKPRKAAPNQVPPSSTTAAPGPHDATKPEASAPAHSLHWSYEGETGPQAWAKLAPEYAKCGNGERQSPIDIRDGMKLELEPIAFEYRPSVFKLVDNGHAIQANVSSSNFMRVIGRRFRLVQLHFHRPSEEAINGKRFEMVVHLVHKDGEDRLAVVAVLVDSGARQPEFQTVLNNLPLEKGEKFAAAITLDANQILPENRNYFIYMGSLTTPPCTEDVLWVVIKQPVQASREQLNLFSRMYPMNSRPIQASMGRVIKESN
jgi:carbonic anhydrase